jgi:hypothetical protein
MDIVILRALSEINEMEIQNCPADRAAFLFARSKRKWNFNAGKTNDRTLRSS